MLREYFLGLIGVVLFISLLVGIAHPRMVSSVRLGAGALAICAILLPIVDVISGFDISDELDGILDGIDYDTTDSAVELAFEEGVARYIAQTYGVREECVTVRADGFDISSLCAERIYVTLSGEAALLDYKRIEEEIRERFTFGGECEVSIDVKG